MNTRKTQEAVTNKLEVAVTVAQPQRLHHTAGRQLSVLTHLGPTMGYKEYLF
jgi:hypothetical protein